MPRGQAAALSHEIRLHNQEEAIKLLGQGGELRRRIQDAHQVRIVDRGAKVVVLGEDQAVRTVSDLLSELLIRVRHGHTPSVDDIDRVLDTPASTSDPDTIPHAPPATIRRDINIRPRTQGQKHYLDSIQNNEMTLVVGPAGTGKTYLAMAAAVSALLSRRVKRIILTRPAVEAGESLGFLPGSLEQKVNPYLRPLYDALYSMVDMDKVQRFIDQERIEVAPLAFMRGRSLDQSFIILDEAQNTTTEQMMMFLTRLGMGSRAIITGDITQIDLPRGVSSGLVEACRILDNIESVGIVHLGKRDVVRNPLVQRVINAYEADKRRREGLDEEEHS